ncbi:MAG: sodium:proline symporter, partial [Clostridia bacterium]|nr:sodium:proline symporter [Clostridia bacterium]
MNLEILAFVLYFVLVLGIGLFFFVRTRKDGDSEKQYFLGGRQMGPWVTALSAQASDMSAWLLMGLPGSVLAFGLGKAWIGIGLAIGTALNWIFVAKRLRKFSKAANDSITLPEYLQNRFLAKTPVLSIITAIVFLISFTIYVASGFVAGTTVFVSLVPGLTRETAMIIFAAVILLYTFLGGFKAVSWTDFFQGTLMFIALLAVPIVCVLVEDLDPTAVNTVYTNLNDGTEYAFVPNVFSASWQDIISGLAWGLGYFGMPHILV